MRSRQQHPAPAPVAAAPRRREGTPSPGLAATVLIGVFATAGAGPAASQLLTVGDEFQVNDNSLGTQGTARVDRNAAGDFVVVWQTPGYSGVNVTSQRFTAEGLPVGDEAHLVEPYSQSAPDVAMASNGDALQVWLDSGSSNVAIRARRIDGQGAPQSPFLITQGTVLLYAAHLSTSATDDGYVVTWNQGFQREAIRGARVDSLGAVSSFAVSSSGSNAYRDQPSVATSSNGEFVVAWRSRPSYGQTAEDGSGAGIFARRFDANAAPLGAELPVNSWTTGDQSRPKVAMTGNGDFVVVWQSAGQDGSGAGALGQWFDSDGLPMAGEFVVAEEWQGEQSGPEVEVDAEGTAWIAWNDQSGGDYDVRVRGFGPQGLPTGDSLVVHEPSSAHQTQAELALDAVGNVVVTWLDGEIRARLLGLNQVGDRVFHDLDFDGVQEAGEPGVGGVSVHLFDDEGMALRSTSTGPDGGYRFAGLPLGQYYLQFELPDDFSFTQRDVGSSPDEDLTDSDAHRATGVTEMFTITDASDDLSWDAGLARGLGDLVWLDDGDGVQEPGEPGLPEVTLRLFDKFDEEIAQTSTDADGRFVLDGGTGYRVMQIDVPQGYALTRANAPATELLDSDFDPSTARTEEILFEVFNLQPYWDGGLVEMSQVSDLMWRDLDGDGIQDVGEPGWPELEVRLLDTGGGLVSSTVTDSGGHYYFTGVDDGTYRIAIDPPDGYEPSPQGVGGDEAFDSDLGADGRSAPFTISAQIERTIDGGLRALPPLFADGFETGDTTSWSASAP